jgi:hypothetical protein
MQTREVIDLFGETVVLQASEARVKPTVRKGYAAPPGTGPEGEKCKTCAHDRRSNEYGAKQFHKCELMKAHWTGGYGTDILANSPACRHWQARAHSQ